MKKEKEKWKNWKIKIGEEKLRLYGLVKKTLEKLMNRISNFGRLEWEQSLNINN